MVISGRSISFPLSYIVLFRYIDFPMFSAFRQSEAAFVPSCYEILFSLASFHFFPALPWTAITRRFMLVTFMFMFMFLFSVDC